MKSLLEDMLIKTIDYTIKICGLVVILWLLKLTLEVALLDINKMPITKIYPKEEKTLGFINITERNIQEAIAEFLGLPEDRQDVKQVVQVRENNKEIRLWKQENTSKTCTKRPVQAENKPIQTKKTCPNGYILKKKEEDWIMVKCY